MPIASETIVQHLIQRRTRLLGYAWTMVGDQHAAEDVFQDVSMAAIRKADQIDDAQHLERWVKQAIRLRGLEVRRNRRGKAELLGPEVLDLLEEAWDRAGELGTDTERTDALRHCIAGLPGPAREIVELRYGQNLMPRKIAEQLGRRVESVYKTISRTHAALRGCVTRRLKAQGGPR